MTLAFSYASFKESVVSFLLIEVAFLPKESLYKEKRRIILKQLKNMGTRLVTQDLIGRCV